MGSSSAPASSRSLAAVLAVSAVLSFTGIFGHALWTPDEPRVAEIGRAMLESGDYVVPRLAGEPFLEKPPLFWWVQAGFYRAFGVTDGVARLPSALFGFLMVLLTYDMARRIASPRAGLFAACALLTVVNFHHMHRALTDCALAFFVTLGYWAFVRASFPERKPVPFRLVLLLHAAAGLAFWSKGIVGVGLLLGPIAIYAAATRRWSFLLCRAHLPGLLMLALLAAAWPVMLHARGGRELLDGFLVKNVLDRFLPGAQGVDLGGHKRPFWDYLLTAPPVLLPWALALPALYRSLVSRRGSMPDGFAFAAWVLPLGVLLLSVPGTKRPLYLLPLLGPVAVSVGVWLDVTEAREDAWSRATRRLLLGAAMLMLAALAGVATVVLLRVPVGGELGAGVMRHEGARLLASLMLAGSLGTGAVLVLHLRRGGAVLRAVLAGACGAWLIVNVTGYRLLDPIKDLRPVVRDLVARGAYHPLLVGYRLDETTRAILPLYGKGPVRNVREKSELVQRLHERPDAKVLMLERRADRLPGELDGNLETLGRWEVSHRRVYVLYGLGPQK